MQNDALRLILVTNKSPSTPTARYLDFIGECVSAGLPSVQLRQKEMSADELYEFAKALQQFLRPCEIPLIINDHVALCQQLDAQGVHLGQSDGNILKAREILGSSKIIGLSVNSNAELQQANRLPIDYIGVGAIFPTANKPDIQTLWGIDGLQQIIRQSHHPVVAIGGITTANADSVIATGCAGIAAIGLFHDASDLQATTRYLNQRYKKKR
ncbi:MAG: thiamine phosphate synthase [Enterobacteriaceae bacterium]